VLQKSANRSYVVPACHQRRFQTITNVWCVGKNPKKESQPLFKTLNVRNVLINWTKETTFSLNIAGTIVALSVSNIPMSKTAVFVDFLRIAPLAKSVLVIDAGTNYVVDAAIRKVACAKENLEDRFSWKN
jgi:hypothetical protein